jgi:hypothetical protein
MTVELEIKDKNILKEVLAFASEKKINSQVFEDEQFEVFPSHELLSAKQMGKRLNEAFTQKGISVDELKEKMQSWR